VSTIRTAQAFGTQNVLASLYDIAVQKTYNVDRKGAIAQGVGLSFFFFSMYAAYGLGEFCSLLFPSPHLFLLEYTQRSALAPHSSMKDMLMLARL
jgi:hypothetical protein